MVDVKKSGQGGDALPTAHQDLRFAGVLSFVFSLNRHRLAAGHFRRVEKRAPAREQRSVLTARPIAYGNEKRQAASNSRSDRL